MTSLSERQPNREHEIQPKLFIGFFGYIHDPDNVQGVAHIKTALADFFGQTNGKKILLLEASSYSPGSRKGHEQWIRDYGPYGFQIVLDLTFGRDLDRLPTLSEINERKSALGSFDLDTEEGLNEALIRKLILPDDLQQHFLYRAYESFGSGLQLRYEYHPGEALGVIKQFRGQWNHYSNTRLQKWGEGNFGEALKAYKLMRYFLYQSGRAREKDIINDVDTIAGSMLRAPEGGALAMLFGASHKTLIDPLPRKIGLRAPVRYQTTLFLPESGIPSDKSIDEGLAKLGFKSQTAEFDVLYGRGCVLELFLGEVATSVREQNKLAHYAFHYEDYFDRLVRLVNSLQLKQIKDLCETKTDLALFLTGNSFAPDLGLAA